jgi:putative ABC transport system permease protein
MLAHFVTSILRNIWQHYKLNAINTIGFSVGIASCLTIGAYVYQQYSFDRHHTNYKRIHRVCLDRVYPGQNVLWAGVGPGVRDGLLELSPVEDATRITGGTIQFVRDEQFFAEEAIMVDSSFFKIFTTNVLQGNIAKVMRDPKSIAITERTAKKYFPDGKALGSSMTFDRIGDFRVDAIVEDYPEASHFHYDMIFNIHGTHRKEDLVIWGSNFGYYTYILLKANESPESLQTVLIPKLTEKYLAAEEAGYKEWRAGGNDYRFFLQPLDDIHLHSNLRWEFQQNGNYTYVNLFMWVGIMVLFIACINFTNLSSARFSTRMKEVGIRKVLGSMRKQIIAQCLLESLLLTLFSMAIAIGLILIVLPYINILTGTSIEIFVLSPVWTATIIILFSLFIGVAAGVYPALTISRFKPASVLNSNSSSIFLQSRFRDYLLVMQFAISFFLICGTFVIYKQINYFKDKDLGYTKENVLVVDRIAFLQNKEAFKNDVLKIPGVATAGYASDVPGKIESASTFKRKSGEAQADVNMALVQIDMDIAEAWKLTIADGRNFAFTDFSDTASNVLINETAIEQLGLPSPAFGSEIVSQHGRTLTVVGVVKDFHIESLHKEIRPMTFLPARNWVNKMSIAFQNGSDHAAARAQVESLWKKYVPQKPFTYFFLDEYYSSLYGSEEVIGKLSIIFTGLALFLTLLGLYGLSSFSAERRTKEIGIRKVLGASAWNIVVLFLNQTNKLILIAIGVSIPIAWYATHAWLEDFAYRTSVSVLLYAVSGFILIAITVLTVLLHSYKATRINPAETLRTN